MAITAEQRQARIGRIGSSDVGALLGLSPYRTPADVALECAGQVEPFEGNRATRRGNLMEPALLAFATEELGPLEFPDTIVHPSGVLAVNLDARLAEKPREIVEAKSSVLHDEWGEQYTDEIPPHYAAQGMFAMALADADVAWFPVVLPGYRDFDFRMYRLDYDARMGERIVEEALRFHDRHIRQGIPADDFKPSIDILKRLKRIPNKTVDVPDELMEEFLVKRAAKKQADDDFEDVKERMIGKLGDAEAGESAIARVTYFQVHCKEHFVKAHSYRALKLKEKKS